jgi:hypothetical protein
MDNTRRDTCGCEWTEVPAIEVEEEDVIWAVDAEGRGWIKTKFCGDRTLHSSKETE